MDLNKIINKYQIRIDEIDKFLNNRNNFEATLYKDFIICYNYSPGEIYIFNLKDSKKYRIDLRKTIKSYILPYKLDNSEITAISINKYFLFGTQLGSIMIYKPGKICIEKIIHYHTQKIISIEQNNILNLFISSSLDGFINIYSLPNAILINSIYLPYFIGDYVLLSYSPLPSFIIYNKEKQIFKVYSINGRKLINKIIKNVNKPKIERTKYFIEYLIINEEVEISKVYKLSYLEEITFIDSINDNDILNLLNKEIINNQKNIFLKNHTTKEKKKQ
jgi:WD40 repeat protein